MWALASAEVASVEVASVEVASAASLYGGRALIGAMPYLTMTVSCFAMLILSRLQQATVAIHRLRLDCGNPHNEVLSC